MDNRFRFTSIAFCVAALRSSSCDVEAVTLAVLHLKPRVTQTQCA